MRKLSLIIMLLFSTILFAQTPEKMSYQAVIRDASGTLITNQAIGMQISILQTSATGTAVYQETQTPTSNTNGLVSLEIGTGTVISGDFTSIDWSNDTYFIKTETDPIGGTNYTITGTSQLLSVPYALYAKTAANVSGLEQITENGNIGWRLTGKNPTKYGDIGGNAVDLSYNNVPSTTKGATGSRSTAMGGGTTASGVVSTAMGGDTTASGANSTAMGDSTTASGNDSTAMGSSTTAMGRATTAMGDSTTASGSNSTAMGRATTASGYISTAMGDSTTASGSRSTAMGRATTASGYISTAMGNNTTASGDFSTAMGRNTTAESYSQTTLGRHNTVVSGSAASFVATDRLFVIGNGIGINYKSDAMVVLKNGTITAPSLDISEITDNKSLITKEYLDANTTLATGLEQIRESGRTGWRLVGMNPVNYGDIGSNAVDLSKSTSSSTTKGATGINSTAMGLNTTASGFRSTAMGYNTTASGSNSTAMGDSTTASGSNSTAMGRNTTASGFSSTAMGNSTTASGANSTAIGNGTRAESLYQTTIGNYNTIDANATPNGYSSNTRLFVIGNGDPSTRSDALVMLRNGNTTLNGNLNVEKVKAADSGDADMKAYVYGLAGADGTSSTVNTDGFVLTKTGTGIYRVTFNVYMDRTSYVAIATLHNTIGFINLIRKHGYVEIRTYNTSGNLSDKGFYFVVYKK